MCTSLTEIVESVENCAELFRNNDLEWRPYVFQDEHTHWIEEQRAVRESCAVVDQSYHMEVLDIEGEEAIGLLEYLGVNSLEKIRKRDPPQAINYLTCNPYGFVIGDVILFHLGPNSFRSVGTETVNNWIRYNARAHDFTVDVNVPYHPFDDHDPPEYRFQIQGPHALNVMESITDNDLPDISFFEMDTVLIDGVETYVLGHGMAAMPGIELFGPHDHHDSVLSDILSTGERYDIRQMGSKAYKTGKISSGWFVFSVPAIYQHEALEGYRDWLDADSLEAQLSIGGSFDSSDITDYYMTPMERGQSNLVAFDHEFIGREALKDKIDDQQRQRVTLVWDSEEVIDIYASLFTDGATNQFITLPDVATQFAATHYDTVLKDDDVIGFSKYPGYLYYEREMLSLATVDVEYSDPGTEVSFIWGDDSAKQGVERNDQTVVDATVAKAPYVRAGRTKL